MGPKALVRGLQDLSKMSKNMFIWSKLSKICIGEVGKFLWICKSQLSLKLQFLTKGPTFFHLIQPCHATHVSHAWFHDQTFIFLFYLIFIDLIHFKSIIIQIKSKNQWNSILVVCTAFIYHMPPNQIRVLAFCAQNLRFGHIWKGKQWW